jgi:sugar-specific transcriptional regulator TrmB
MNKVSLSLDDAYDDFGFSVVSEDELRSLERKLQQEVQEKSSSLIEIEKTYQGKLEQLYKAIMPLLKNLAKDGEKEYIFWPNRVEKMQQFIAKVESIVND